MHASATVAGTESASRRRLGLLRLEAYATNAAVADARMPAPPSHPRTPQHAAVRDRPIVCLVRGGAVTPKELRQIPVGLKAGATDSSVAPKALIHQLRRYPPPRCAIVHRELAVANEPCLCRHARHANPLV